MKRLIRNSYAFSLIELMVVMSIISLLTALAVPKILSIKIDAARAEVKNNTNAFYTLVNAYQAENGFMPGITYGEVTEMGEVSTFTGPNPLGFSVNDPSRLRYIYFLTRKDTSVPLVMRTVDGIPNYPTFANKFVVRAQSADYEKPGDGYYRYGAAGAPISLATCAEFLGLPAYFDNWVMEGETRALQNDSLDAKALCIR